MIFEGFNCKNMKEKRQRGRGGGGGKTHQIFIFGFQYVAQKKRKMIKNLYFISSV